jgi:hypothetical protein
MGKLAALLLFGTLSLSPMLSLAAEEGGHSLEQLAVEMVHTAEQHLALARHYHAKAEEARAEARRHQSMGSSYGGGKFTQRQMMQRHCENLSEKYTGMADDYDALAQLHEEEAKKAQ